MTEVNIVPLLNLAFVLLVIFIVTTTPLVNDLEVSLPTAARREKDPPPKVNYITVDAGGQVHVNTRPVDLSDLHQFLVGLRMDDPDLNVIVRGDGKVAYRLIRHVLDICQQANVTKVDLATEPATPR